MRMPGRAMKRTCACTLLLLAISSCRTEGTHSASAFTGEVLSSWRDAVGDAMSSGALSQGELPEPEPLMAMAALLRPVLQSDPRVAFPLNGEAGERNLTTLVWTLGGYLSGFENLEIQEIGSWSLPDGSGGYYIRLTPLPWSSLLQGLVVQIEENPEGVIRLVAIPLDLGDPPSADSPKALQEPPAWDHPFHEVEEWLLSGLDPASADAALLLPSRLQALGGSVGGLGSLIPDLLGWARLLQTSGKTGLRKPRTLDVYGSHLVLTVEVARDTEGEPIQLPVVWDGRSWRIQEVPWEVM